MKNLHSINLFTDIQDHLIFVDTNTLIAAISYPEFFDFLSTMKNTARVNILTIPSVSFEFIRGSHTIKKFNERIEFFQKLVTIYQIEPYLPEMQEFIVVLQRMKGVIGYTDFLLYACLFKFPDSFLLTQDHHDFSGAFLTRQHIITLDTEKDVWNHALYQFSEKKFNAVAKRILEEEK